MQQIPTTTNYVSAGQNTEVQTLYSDKWLQLYL